ncbi:hypothetical protein RHSIM_Rhsim08G0042100 [Rhododendron simsii]|uniref:Uncharacterized protein n=1 Tax=Rhododendron simsii TaxID=118357 RepID=A0A834GMS2_RHOSS|nr:hypothetical protein RHSIM_Rhsim08G0042100 [Rhododendron simsii]
MRDQNQQQQTRVLHEMCSMILQILRSPPFPNPFDSSSFSLSSLYRTTSPVSSPSAFASLFLTISLALMMLGSVTFAIGFILMPWVVGLVLLFCFVTIVSDLLELGRSILCPTASSKDVNGENFAISHIAGSQVLIIRRFHVCRMEIFMELRHVVEEATDRGTSLGLDRDIGIAEFIFACKGASVPVPSKDEGGGVWQHVHQRDFNPTGVDVDVNGDDEDGVECKEEESVEGYGLAVGFHAPKLHLFVVTWYLEQQPRLQQQEQHHSDQHRPPVRHCSKPPS